MFRKLKLNSSINRLIEEKLYEIVADEMDKNEIRKGLWAKALTQSGGDDAKVKGKYISLRVKSLRDEENLVDSILNIYDNHYNYISVHILKHVLTLFVAIIALYIS